MMHEGRSELEIEFYQSWVKYELQFAQSIIIYQDSEMIPLYEFISHLRTKNRDILYKLRAGAQSSNLILSRSIRHGLKNQPHLVINSWLRPPDDKIRLWYYNDDSDKCSELIVTQLLETKIEDNFQYKQVIKPVQELLTRLLAQPLT